MMDPDSTVDADQGRQQTRVDDAWRTHATAALRFATVLVGPDDAHDVASQAFMKVTRATGWAGLDRPQSYLLRAVSREAVDHHRQRTRRQRRDLVAVPATAAHDHSTDVDVVGAIRRLSIEQRSVIFLAYWHDLTEAAIADTLGISTGTVHRNLVRARIQLRKALQ